MKLKKQTKAAHAFAWTQSVQQIVKQLPRDFTTSDVYHYEKRLQKAHPQNHNVRAKIRQQLQVLRDKGVLRQGKARGSWSRN